MPAVGEQHGGIVLGRDQRPGPQAAVVARLEEAQERLADLVGPHGSAEGTPTPAAPRAPAGRLEPPGRPRSRSLIAIPPTWATSPVFGLIAIETMGIPVPGETALIAGRARRPRRASSSIAVLVVLASAAAILGDNVGFALGRRFGRRRVRAPRPGLRPAPGPAGPRRAVLRPPWRQGGLPRALGERPAHRLGLAGRDEPDALAVVPGLERPRWHLRGRLASGSAPTSPGTPSRRW